MTETDYIFALQERIKELGCLYRIADIANRPELDLDDVLRTIMDIIPPSMQFPEQASVRLAIDGVSISTSSYAVDQKSIRAEIHFNHKSYGYIEVCYPKTIENNKELDFLPEEEQLLKTIAQQIALVIERKNIESTNARLEEQLRHADRLATIGQLSAGIAHEINEPLATILGFSQLVAQDNTLSHTSAKDIRKIVNAAMHAREIVRKLMLFSRQMPPKKEEVDLNKIIEDGLYFLESRCAKQSVTIERILEKGLPKIIADPGQIHQILVNLTVNAMQAMPSGGLVTIKTAWKNDFIEFSVSDTGIGMDEDMQHKLFIPFFTTKDIDQGTGLGLSVTHGIVSSHHGEIKVISAPGKGSTFTITLPIKKGKPVQKTAPLRSAKQASQSEN